MKKVTNLLETLFALLFSVTIVPFLTQAQVVLPDIQLNASSYEDVDLDGGSRAIAVLNDTVYTVWRANPTQTTSNIYFSKSTNGGLSFSNEVNVSAGTTPMDTEMPVIAVDSDGTIYVTWTGITGTNGVWNIWLSKSSNGGITFQDPVMITTSNSLVYSSLGVFGDNVYIFYADALNYPCADYFFVRSTNNGQSFENPIQIDEVSCTGYVYTYFSNLTAMDIDASGNIYLAWVDSRRADGNGDIFMSKSTDNGQSFSANVMVNSISSVGADSVQYYPSIAVDGSQNVYVSFVDLRLGSDWPNHRVYISKSTDGGNTFAPEVLLDGYDNACNSHNIAITEQGKLAAAMCATTTTGWGVWLRESSDGGSSYSTPVVLSNTQGTDDFSNLHITTGPNENVYAIWKDDRQGSSNVYFARTGNPVSITESSEANEYSIYPNPTNDSFVLVAPEGEMNIEVSIYNSNCQKVYDKISSSNRRIDADLSQGVYFVSIKSQNIVRNLKLVKN